MSQKESPALLEGAGFFEKPDQDEPSQTAEAARQFRRSDVPVFEALPGFDPLEYDGRLPEPVPFGENPDTGEPWVAYPALALRFIEPDRNTPITMHRPQLERWGYLWSIDPAAAAERHEQTVDNLEDWAECLGLYDYLVGLIGTSDGVPHDAPARAAVEKGLKRAASKIAAQPDEAKADLRKLALAA